MVMNKKESLELEQQIRLENVLVKKTYDLNIINDIVRSRICSILVFLCIILIVILKKDLEGKEVPSDMYFSIIPIILFCIEVLRCVSDKIELYITSNDIYIRNVEHAFLFFTKKEIWIKSCAIKDIVSCEIGASGGLYFKYTEDKIKKYLSKYKKELLEDDKLEKDENLKLTAEELEELLLEANENIRKEGELICRHHALNKKSLHDICDTINKYIRK